MKFFGRGGDNIENARGSSGGAKVIGVGILLSRRLQRIYRSGVFYKELKRLLWG